MRSALSLLAVLALVAGLAAAPARAENSPLFVNLTSDDGHRVTMALSFSKGQLERGHPLTVWLNDKAVLVGAEENAEDFADQQTMLKELMAAGAVVIACPLCMKHYGVEEGDLLDGVKVGNPELTGDALFKDATQTLTW
jgi:sulfur relay (sulfurtransferase) complex TusBCD TusD component (DsrE family)